MRLPSLTQILGLSVATQQPVVQSYTPTLPIIGAGYTAGMQLASMDRLPANRRANILHMLVEALAYINEQWLEENPGTPSMYSVAPNYQLKMRPLQIDLWADIPTVMAQGGGDCKDFSAWRIAELRRAGQAMVFPEIRYLPQQMPNGEVAHVWHVLVRQGAKTEDPSRLLGMPTHVSPQVLQGLFH